MTDFINICPIRPEAPVITVPTVWVIIRILQNSSLVLATLGIDRHKLYMILMAKKNPTGGAPNQRQLRVGEQIRRRLSEMLQRGELHDADITRYMITVGEVRMSPDLSVATAYVLPLGGNQKEEALLALRKNRYEIRHGITKALSIKFAPEIWFEIDDTFDRMDATAALLAKDHVRQDLDD